MAALQLILLEGFHDPEGNRLLKRFEEHTGLVGDPFRDSHSRLYHVPWESFEEADTAISEIFERHLSPPEPLWREHLTVGTEGWG
jgi:hypothetical protein